MRPMDARVPASRPLVGALLLVLAVGCGGGSPSTTAAAAVDATEPVAIATEISAELLAPLEGLGPCGDPPTPIDADVPGLVLPTGAEVTRVSEQGPVTQVEGWVPLTPIGVRADFVTRDDVEVLTVEDEVWESETLLSTGTHRTFVKAQGICRTESVFVALVSAEDAG